MLLTIMKKSILIESESPLEEKVIQQFIDRKINIFKEMIHSEGEDKGVTQIEENVFRHTY